MRKELRVGFGIGGVLLAVLIGALVVRSHMRKPRDVASVTQPTDTKPDATSTDTTTVPADVATGEPTPPPTVTPTPGPTAGATPTPATPPDPFTTDPTVGNDKWAQALQTGTLTALDETATHTVTPTGRAIGDHSTPSTPGSFPAGAGIDTGTGPLTPRSAELPTHDRGAAHGKTHTIAQGETLSSIARSVYGSKKFYTQIEKANPGVNPNRLRPGTVLNLPDIAAGERHAAATSSRGSSSATASSTPAATDSNSQYVIKSGDSLYRISMKLYGTPSKMDAIYDLNKDHIGPERQRLRLGAVLKLPMPPTSNGR